jgi:glycosyltransferase involved in cell wall biosynthesis
VGIQAAKGEYIAFVDADDLWAKDKLRLQVDLLTKTGLAWVYCDAYAFDDESGKRLYRLRNIAHQYSGDILKALFLANFIPSPTPIIHRTVFEYVGYFDEDLSLSEDWNMWLKIAAHFPVGLVSQPLAFYRIRATSNTGSANPQRTLQGGLTVIEKAVAREPVRLGPLKNRRMASFYSWVAGICAQKKMWFEARRMYIQAAKLSPGLFRAYAGWAACFFDGWLWRAAFDLRDQLFRRL